MLPHLTDRFTCFLPSTRGKGLSAHAREYSLQWQQEDVMAFIDSIGQPVPLFGWSGGGLNALAAAERSEAVTAVVAYEPAVFETIDEQTFADLDATGLLELKPESELLLPFEGQGVDSTWVLEMPQAANSFDYRTVADVLFIIDYTAQYSAGYRRQVIGQLDRSLEAERPFRFRQEFVDQWYDLHNPDLSEGSITIQFETRRADFPPNIDDLRIEHLLLFFARADDTEFEIEVESLRFTSADGSTGKAGSTQIVGGTISTRRLNGIKWKALRGLPPLGEWELRLPNTKVLQEQFANEQIEEILFVITFKAETPEWPI